MMSWHYRLGESAQRHGGRSNLVRAWGARVRASVGGYRPFRHVDWREVHRLVFVCKGNICRSPYAEGRARALGFDAGSCGLEAQTGRPVDPTAAEAARQRDLDLEVARATALREFQLGPGDLMLAMDPHQLRDASAAGGGAYKTQTTLLGLWSSPVTPVIPDPYGGNTAGFHHCFSVIDSAVARIGMHLTEAGMSKALGEPGESGRRSYL